MSESKQQVRGGLTWRSFAVCLVALFVMGIWIEYEELYNTYGGPLAENSPPNSAVGVICAVLVIGGLLYKLRRSLKLVAAELVVIYAALIIAAPLMTQGMWHRLFGLVAAIPHNQDFKSYESLPSMLWPHGPNLVRNNQFAKGMEGFTHSGGGRVVFEDVGVRSRGIRRSPFLSNDGQTNTRCTLSFPIERYDEQGREVMVPGERFLFSLLVKTEGFAKGSAYFVRMQTDDGPQLPLLASVEETRPTFALPEGFQRIGINPLTAPAELNRRLTFHVGLKGSGRLAVQDLQFINVQAVEGLYAGRKVVRGRNLPALDGNERDFTSVRPDNMLSLAGLRYLMTGYIPLSQWAMPALAWGTLVGLLFIGFLGMNTLMRKQWVENERFTFPLTIIPKHLFMDEDGRLIIFRNRIFWLGFICVLPLVLAKGISFYLPGFPSPLSYATVYLNTYFNNPLLKAFTQNLSLGYMVPGLPMCILAVALLIETDVLFSLWSMFIIFQLWYPAGAGFNLTRFAGYPWDFQQAMGAFIAYALIAVFIARQHLWYLARVILGRASALGDQQQEVLSYRTALLLVVAAFIGLAGWGMWTQMGAFASLLFFGYMLLCGFTASKIRAEMGAPWSYMTPYYGMQFVAAVGGFAVFKSTGMLVATIAAGFMCTTCFLLIAPAQVEMMELSRHFKVRPKDVGTGMTLGLLGGLFIGGFVVLCWAYGLGANNMKTRWPYEQNWYFNSGFRQGELKIDRAFNSGTLMTPETQPLNIVRNEDAKGLGIGAGITALLAVLRAKLTWFPFHPIGYVLAGTHFMRACWFPFLIAWLVRLLLFRIGGAHIIRRGLVPFCVGMFLACIAAIVIFDIVGIIMRMQGVTDVYSKLP